MTCLHGFEQICARRIDELDAVLHEYSHAASGAKLCWLEREDENKTFCAGFRTLPFDDSGVFHILEHSVLCGSRKYPVKEPFVELMKGSLNTFLNAFTFPDKTCYPVSSRNDQDFLNLMGVYLDAVFFPSIYDRPEIFQQEGWHYELQDGELGCSGVVLNEMKGAFADPDTLLANALTRALYPDTPYRFVSGGDPDEIVKLTYEQFLASHRRFYHPSNSYLLLDGRLQLDKVLALLDSYLSQFTAICPDTAIATQQPVQASMRTIAYQLPAGEPAERRAKLGKGYVIGTYQDTMKIFAVQILCDVLCGSNHAPLCRAILERQLAEDVLLSCDDEAKQPWLMLQIQNFRQEDLPEIERTLHRTLEQLAENGLDHAQLQASLASLEFRLRERDYGTMPRGLVFAFEILSSWLYDGDPAEKLSFGSVFDRLRGTIDVGYFEALLREVFLDAAHSASVLMLPSRTYDEEHQKEAHEALAALQSTMTQTQLDQIAQQQTRLLQLQQEPDSQASLATIPHVQLSDIPREPEALPTEVSEDGKLWYHAVQTDGIVYPVLYFSADDLTPEELPYAALLTAALAQLPAGDMDALEVQKQLRLRTGSFGVSMMPCTKYGSAHAYRLFAAVSCSALEEKLTDAMQLAGTILTDTKFTDSGKLLEIIRQMREGLQQQITGSGSSFAMMRASAAVSEASACAERCGGITFYRWLRELEQDFDRRAQPLQQTLAALAQKLFTRARLTCSVTGSQLQVWTQAGKTLADCLPEGSAPGAACCVPCMPELRLGVIIPAEVSFAAAVGDLERAGGEYCGQMRIACHVTSLGCLWNEIRVQGGAYGAGISARETGLISAYTYRDPDCARSLRVMSRAGSYLKQAEAGQSLQTNIIGAISDAEPLLSPRLQGAVADARRIKGITEELRCRLRHEMLDMTPEQLPMCGAQIDACLQAGAVCVLGPREQLAKCEGLQLQEL